MPIALVIPIGVATHRAHRATAAPKILHLIRLATTVSAVNYGISLSHIECCLDMARSDRTTPGPLQIAKIHLWTII